MPLQKTDAVILRSLDHSETSKILTFYTRSSGKMTVMAKGARSNRSRFGGTLEVLNHISTLIYEKEGRDIQFLSQAEIQHSFANIRADLKRTAVALALCELLNRLEVGQEANPLLFRLLLTALTGLDAGTGDEMNTFYAFELHISDLMGFRPTFQCCIDCGGSLSFPAPFELGSGGMRCRNCREDKTTSFILDSDTAHALRALQTVHMTRLGELDFKRTTRCRVGDFLHDFLRYNVEGLHDLKALTFLTQI